MIKMGKYDFRNLILNEFKFGHNVFGRWFRKFSDYCRRHQQITWQNMTSVTLTNINGILEDGSKNYWRFLYLVLSKWLYNVVLGMPKTSTTFCNLSLVFDIVAGSNRLSLHLLDLNFLLKPFKPTENGVVAAVPRRFFTEDGL